MWKPNRGPTGACSTPRHMAGKWQRGMQGMAVSCYWSSKGMFGGWEVDGGGTCLPGARGPYKGVRQEVVGSDVGFQGP